MKGGLSLNILLINPSPSGTLKAVGVLFPLLGLLYVAAYIEKEDHHVVVRDLVVLAPHRPFIEDLDTFPFFERTLLGLR